MEEVTHVKPSIQFVRSAAPRSAPAAQVADDPLREAKGASQLATDALAFYARQGYDGGLKARRALVAMIEAEQGEPPGPGLSA
jgi:hypothetical protein